MKCWWLCYQSWKGLYCLRSVVETQSFVKADRFGGNDVRSRGP